MMSLPEATKPVMPDRRQVREDRLAKWSQINRRVAAAA